MTHMHEIREQVAEKASYTSLHLPRRFNVLKRTPQLIELRAPCL